MTLPSPFRSLAAYLLWPRLCGIRCRTMTPACRSVLLEGKTCLCKALQQQHSNNSAFWVACSAQHLVQPVLVLPFRSMGRASCSVQMSCRSITGCSRPWLRRGRSFCRQLRSQAAVCSSHPAQAPLLLASECHGSPALQLLELHLSLLQSLQVVQTGAPADHHLAACR